MNNRKARSGLYGIASAFMFFTAYDLFKGRNDPESTMPMWLLIAFMVFFALAGVALLVFAIRLWIHSKDEDQQEEKEDKMR